MPIDWNHVEVRFEPNMSGRVRCEKEWRLKDGWSEKLRDFDFWLVWAGKGRMRLRSGEITLRPGVCIWMRPGGFYAAEHDVDDRLGVTFIHFDLVRRAGRTESPRIITREVEPAAEVHYFEDLVYVDSVARRVQALCSIADLAEKNVARGITKNSLNIPPHPARLAAQALFEGLLRDIDAGMFRAPDAPRGGTPRRHHETMTRLASAISESPNTAPDVSQMAREAGYSVDHFTRIFTNVIGISPQAYVLQCKMARAKNLLRESGLTVKEVADALGYADIFFFSRQFRAKTGMTPTQYRKGGGAPEISQKRSPPRPRALQRNSRNSTR